METVTATIWPFSLTALSENHSGMETPVSSHHVHIPKGLSENHSGMETSTCKYIWRRLLGLSENHSGMETTLKDKGLSPPHPVEREP